MKATLQNRWQKYLALCLTVVISLTMVFGFTGTNTLLSAKAEIGTLAEEFKDVPNDAKPMVRFWLPGGNVHETTLRQDLRNIAAEGFGGIEIVSINLPSGSPAYGSAEWDRAMEIIVDEAQTLGLQVDATNGPSWPISAPGKLTQNQEGTSVELCYNTSTVNAGATYNQAIPNSTSTNPNRTGSIPKVLTASAYKVVGTSLDQSTYVDLTPYVTINETNQVNSVINWTAPEGDGQWRIFLFLTKHTGQGTVVGGGGTSYVIDHFSLAGARASIDYWEEAFAEKDYYQYITNIFNDSLEYAVHWEWTPGFEKIFKEQKGYDLFPYLAAAGKGTDSLYQTTGGPNYDFTDAQLSNQIKNDVKDVITYCYVENHLKPLQEMTEKYGMDIRYQTAYNKSMEKEASALAVGIPETETLNRGALDQIRLNASAIHMTDKKFLSYETHAEFGYDYAQSLEDICWWQKRAWSVGINRQTFHGASYSGVGSNGNAFTNAYPGWGGFVYGISNNWNRITSPKNTNDVLNYIARNNYIMQKDAQIDVAVFRHTFEDAYQAMKGGDGAAWFPDGGILQSYGYSYDFVGPAVLDLDTAVVTNGVLNAAGPAYKALIIHDQVSLSIADAEKLAELADAGWPMVFVGDTPSELMFHSDVVAGYTDQDIVDAVDNLLEEKNVVQVADYSNVPDALSDLGVAPDADYEEPTDILTTRRTDDTGEYYYMYNYNKASRTAVNSSSVSATGSTVYPLIDKAANFSEKSVTVTLQGEGRPYYMDAWSGEIVPITEYKRGDGSVTLDLDFDEDEAKTIALLTDEQAAANGITVNQVYVEEAGIHNQTSFVDNNVFLKATETGSFTTKLSDGSVRTNTVSSLQKSFAIGEWTLQINSIDKGSTNLFKDSVWTMKAPVTLTTLVPWKDIPGMGNHVSGIGTYTANFTLDNGWNQGYGAYIHLGEVEDTFTVTVNDTKLPMTNQINTLIDIGPYVQKGNNTIVVEVATTLGNVSVKTGYINASTYMGNPGKGSIPFLSDGLLGVDGVVKVTPYANVFVALAIPTTIEFANPSKTKYEANEPFDVIVTTGSDATKVKIVNELGNSIGKLNEVVTRNDDGTKSYRITLMIGTPGELRTLTAMVMGQTGDYQAVGSTLDVTIIPATPVQNAENIISALSPGTCGVNIPFTVTVVTSRDITKIKIVGETGASIGTLGSSVVTNGNTKTWTISIKVGSKGNRTLTALGAGSTGGYGTDGKSFNIVIQ